MAEAMRWGRDTAPPNFNIVGTCGACGGPLLQSIFMHDTGTGPVESPVICGVCAKIAKPQPNPIYGPIREMQ